MSNSFFHDREAALRIANSSHPSEESLDKLKPLLRDPDIEREFWTSLERPEWLATLYEAGYFNSPPRAERQANGGLRFPRWDAGEYLAKVSKFMPEEVASILQDIDTDNMSVLRNILESAKFMPSSVAKLLVPTVKRSMESGSLLLNQKDVSDLCVKLAKENEVDAALDIASTLFATRASSDLERANQRDDYWYKKGLSKVAPILTGARAMEFLPLLCSWLDAAIRSKTYVDADTGADTSYSWRPAIEEHEQNRDHDFAGSMVGIVRSVFEEAIRIEAVSLTEALDIIDKQVFHVFSRMRIHLIAEFADQHAALARAVMLDRSLFDDFKFKHEYAMLIGRRWNMLESDEKDTWFSWIDAEPDMSSYDESIERNLGREATDEDRKSRVRWWQYEKLHWIRDHLSGKRLAFYEQMKREHGDPQLADLNSYVGRAEWGNKTPIALDELLPVDLNTVLERISQWEPDTPDPTKGTVEGLASTFRKYIATNRVGFSKKASAVKDRPPVFVRTFLNEMITAIKSCEPIELGSVLELCQWVVEQPLNPSPPVEIGGGRIVDNGWQWTRDEVSEIAEAICAAKVDERVAYTPSDDIRRAVWMLIDKLSRDTPDSYIVKDISEEDPRVYDYTDLGINSPRGKAMESALEYARWIANEVKQVTDGHEVIPGGFEAMPEVRELLEWQITSDNRSYAAMSILGSRMGLINWIDSDWLQANAVSLFNLEGIKQDPVAGEGWAAWNSFLVWVRPHIEFYRRFKSQFSYAVSQASEVQLFDHSREQPMLHLGEHLVLLYGRGELGLDDDDGILRTFIQSANPAIRRHTFGFIGRSLSGDEDLPNDILDRFKALWDLYWGGPGRQDAKERPDSLLFGTWFTCGRFHDKWLLERMLEFAEVAPNVEPDHSVAERLAEIAHTDIMSATKILGYMIYGDKEGWHISGWTDDAHTILELAMKSDGAHEQAEQIIDHLGRRGHIEFGKLLDTLN